MKKIIAIAFLLLIVSAGYAQTPQKIGGPQGYQAEVFKANKYLVPGVFADTPSIETSLRTEMIGTIILRRPPGGDTTYWGWIGYKWIQIAGTGGGGGGAVSSVFGRTGAVSAASGDYSAFYPLLSGSYNNPSWINQLAWSKITGVPSFLLVSDTLTMLLPYLRSNVAAATYVPLTRTITINGTAQDLTTDRSWTIPAGEANTASNLSGSGVGLFKDKSGVDLRFKRLKGGYRINITDNTDSVTVSLDSATQTLTDGATVTFNASLGVSARVTLAGNRTLAFSNFSAGTYLTLVVTQDGTGGRTLALPAGTKVINGGAGAVTLTTAANAEDILTFFKIGTTVYCNYGKNYN